MRSWPKKNSYPDQGMEYGGPDSSGPPLFLFSGLDLVLWMPILSQVRCASFPLSLLGKYLILYDVKVSGNVR